MNNIANTKSVVYKCSATFDSVVLVSTSFILYHIITTMVGIT